MLIHIEPKLLEPYVYTKTLLLDISIPEFGLILYGGQDVIARRPYPNKRYLVACRKKGQKAITGFYVKTEERIHEYTVYSRWLIDGEIYTHVCKHTILDAAHEVVSDDWTSTPKINNIMEICRPICEDATDRVDIRGIIKVRVQELQHPTIEIRKLFDPSDTPRRRYPKLEDAFKAKTPYTHQTLIKLPWKSPWSGESGMLYAEIIVLPYPMEDQKGKHPNYRIDELQLEIFVSFTKESGEIVESMVPWENLICEQSSYLLKGGVELSAAALDKLDGDGWDYMNGIGIMPNHLILVL